MNRKTSIPPIKSQGIKTKLVPWIRSLLPESVDGRWVEPFLGTGVVGFNSGFTRALFGDSNPHIIRFYRAIQTGEISYDSVKVFLEKEGERLRNAPDDGYQHFREIRDRFNQCYSPLDFLFLSRAGFNGMMRFNKKGEWNIPFCKKPDRFAPAYITKIVNQVKNCSVLMKKDWVFQNSDFETTLSEVQKGDIIYCDPPYYGRYADYFNAWTEEDEARLFHILNETPAHFILSTWHHNNYRENEMVKKYWSRFNMQTHNHFYHNGGKEENRNPVVEALVFNFDPPTSGVLCGEGEPLEQMSLSLT